MDTVIPNVLEHVDMQLDAAGTVVVWCQALSYTSFLEMVQTNMSHIQVCLFRVYILLVHNRFQILNKTMVLASQLMQEQLHDHASEQSTVS